jgi:hypothetical protein
MDRKRVSKIILAVFLTSSLFLSLIRYQQCEERPRSPAVVLFPAPDGEGSGEFEL